MKHEEFFDKDVSFYKNISQSILKLILSNIFDKIDFKDLNIPPKIPSNVYIICVEKKSFMVRNIFDINRYGSDSSNYRYDVCHTTKFYPLQE